MPTRALLGDPQSAGYKTFKRRRDGTRHHCCRRIPIASPLRPTRTRFPQPFDNTYNVPEHDEFVITVKYIRDDRFVYENMIDEATRKRVGPGLERPVRVVRLPRHLPAPARRALQVRPERQDASRRLDRAGHRGAARRSAPVRDAAARATTTTVMAAEAAARAAAMSTTASSSPAAPGAGRSPRRKSSACARSTTRTAHGESGSRQGHPRPDRPHPGRARVPLSRGAAVERLLRSSR